MRRTTKAVKILILIALLSISFTLFNVSLGFLYLHHLDNSNLSFDHGNVFFGVQHEANPLALNNQPETLDHFMDIYTQLTSLPFEYYEIYQQHLDCSLSNNRFFDVYQQQFVVGSSHAHCVQISRNVQTDFDFALSSGRLFNEEDFSCSTGIPVIMGWNYKDTFRIGDSFSAKYLFSPFTFHVIGFLREDSVINYSSLYIDLDSCIVMPSFVFSYTPGSEGEYITQKIHYANKTSGKIKVPSDSFDDAYYSLQAIVSSSEVGEYSISSSSFEKMEQVHGKKPIVKLVLSMMGFVVLTTLSFILTKHAAKSMFSSGKKTALLLTSIMIVFLACSCSVFLSIKLINEIGLSVVFPLPNFLLATINIISIYCISRKQRLRAT